MFNLFNRKDSNELAEDLAELKKSIDSMVSEGANLAGEISDELDTCNSLEILHAEYLETLDEYKRTKKIFKQQQKRLAKLQKHSSKLLGRINSINQKMH